jgi:glycosyltransferase involved in cell wall biosynthesis
MAQITKQTLCNIFISPSGNFYGSEQVLFDYIKNTHLHFHLFLPKNSLFESKLNEIDNKNFIKKGFTNIKRLYLEIFIKLLFSKFKSVYLNEAGHIKYINLLAKFFPKVNFVVHIRLVEDTNLLRINKSLPNLRFVTISKYIHDLLPVKSELLYDPYPFEDTIQKNPIQNGKIKIGVIGRLSIGKGLDKLIQLASELQNDRSFEDFEFYLYGDPIYSNESNFFLEKILSFKMLIPMGFEPKKNKMYQNINAVMHLCETEPLGRIFLEAINYELPLIGFNSGGIGEIARITNSTDLLVALNDNWIVEWKEKLLKLKKDFKENSKINTVQKAKAMEVFSLANYVSALDQIIIN